MQCALGWPDVSLGSSQILTSGVRPTGRQYIGSAEGEDLQHNFRPSWSRTPNIDAIVGSGSFEDKVRGALEARKERTLQEKVDYPSYANFQGHVLDWGIKMILTKVFEHVHLLAYQVTLARVAEEHGGTRIAFYYDLLLRLKVAKELESGVADVRGSLCSLDREVLADAKSKFEVKAKDLGRQASSKHNQGSSSAAS